MGQVLLVGPLAYRFIADRRRRLFGVCELGSHKPRVEWTPATLSGLSVAPCAVLLTFAVLLGAYMVRLPGVSSAFPSLAAASRSVLGRSPLAFGFGQIDVFNEADLKLYHNYQMTFLVEADGNIAVPATIKILTRGFSETMDGLLTNDLRIAARNTVYCSTSWGDHIANFYADTLPPSDPARDLLVRTRFFVALHPSRDDLLSYRYAPLTWVPTCTTYASIGDPACTARRISYRIRVTIPAPELVNLRWH